MSTALRRWFGRTLPDFAWYALVVVAGIALLAASRAWYWQADWTRAQRNSLAESSLAVTRQIDGPVELHAYLAGDDASRQALVQLVDRFRRHKPDISLRLTDPADSPDEVRERNVSRGGELFVRYRGREQRLRQVSEQTLANALQRLLRGGERWVVFLDGHGERDPFGAANHGLGNFGQRLRQSGLQLHQQSLALTPALPDNTALLVIASARTPYLPGEVALVVNYVRAGGNLLWLLEPNQLADLEPLAEELGVSLLPGVVVDPNTRTLDIARMDFVLAADFAADHPATAGFSSLCLLPLSAAVQTRDAGWERVALVRSNAAAWAELGEVEGATLDERAGDRRGPHDLVVALTRARAAGEEQRVVVAGDGDFLANTYLDNGGNAELGLRLLNYLSGDDALIAAQRQPPLDVAVELSTPLLAGFAVTFLLLVPAALAGGGSLVRWRRRRR